MAKHKANLSELAELFMNSGGISKAYESALNIFYLCYYDKSSSFYNKEIYQLSDEEISEFFIKKFLDLSVSSIISYTSGYRKYFKYLTDQEVNTEYTFDFYDALITSITDELITKKKYYFLSSSDVYNRIYCEENQDRLTLILLFEGIKTNEFKYINNIKLEYSQNSLLALHKRNIILPLKFLNILNETINEANNKKHNCLITYKNGENVNDNKIENAIGNRIQKIRKINLNQYEKSIVRDELKLSGKCFYLSLIEQILSQENADFTLKNEHFNKVNKRYNDSTAQQPIRYLKIIYQKYKISNAYKKIDVSQYMNVYYDIMRIYDEHTDRADKDLGNLGEKYIEDLLIKQYGKDKVSNCTADGVGYDFKVENDGIITMYEVKSTRQDKNNDFSFYMTIKEIKMAFEHKEKFKLCIVYFKNNDSKGDSQNLYVIENPLSAFELIKDKAERIVDMDYDKSGFMPLEVKIKVPFEKINEYNNKSL